MHKITIETEDGKKVLHGVIDYLSVEEVYYHPKLKKKRVEITMDLISMEYCPQEEES